MGSFGFLFWDVPRRCQTSRFVWTLCMHNMSITADLSYECFFEEVFICVWPCVGCFNLLTRSGSLSLHRFGSACSAVVYSSVGHAFCHLMIRERVLGDNVGMWLILFGNHMEILCPCIDQCLVMSWSILNITWQVFRNAYDLHSGIRLTNVGHHLTCVSTCVRLVSNHSLATFGKSSIIVLRSFWLSSQHSIMHCRFLICD